jgi:predicted amidohydrolase
MGPVTSTVLKLAVHQFAPRLRDREANLDAIAEVVATTGANIILTPELSVTGYDVGDDAAGLAVPVVDGQSLPLVERHRSPFLDSSAHVVLGLVEKGDGGTPYNAAVVCQQGVVRFRHRKLHLPTYGMFDEARFFGHGHALGCFDLSPDWRLGILVCEDFWHPGLAYVLASSGIHLLLVLAAAPGRGIWQGGENGRTFASNDAWERIARVTAQLYGIYVALANRTGVEGGVTFGGGSLVAGPTGDVLARAGELEDAVLSVDLSCAELERARQPFAHARDDDPHLVSRELRRVIGA